MRYSILERTRYGWPYIIFIWCFALLSYGLVGLLVIQSGNYSSQLIRQNALEASLLLLLLVLCVFLRYRPARSSVLASEDALNLCVVLVFEREVAIAVMAMAGILNTISQLVNFSRREHTSAERHHWYTNIGEVFFQSGLLAFVTLTGSTILALFKQEITLVKINPREILSILCTYLSIVLIRWSIAFVQAWSRGVPLIEFSRDAQELRSLLVLLTETANVLLAIAMAIVLRTNLPVFIILAGVMVSLVALLSNQARITERLQTTIWELKILNSVGKSLSNSTQTRKDLLAALEVQGKELFGANLCTIYLLDEHNDLKLFINEAAEKLDKADTIANDSLISLAEWCVRNRHPLRLTDITRQATAYGYQGLTTRSPYRSWLGVPLESDTKILGVIGVANSRSNAFTEQHQELLHVLGQQLASALDHARLFEMATIDALTGLLTPRYLRQKLAEEFEQAKRFRRNLALIMVDIDYFKKINDNYGHEVGNEVLQHLAKVLQQQLRDSDIAARYGGEEFTVLLPGTTKEAANRVAERLRQAIEASPINTAAGIVRITASLGLVNYPEIMVADQNELISFADKALYQSKQQGRNRVTLAVPELTSS